jgi:hypothetical protein
MGELAADGLSHLRGSRPVHRRRNHQESVGADIFGEHHCNCFQLIRRRLLSLRLTAFRGAESSRISGNQASIRVAS